MTIVSKKNILLLVIAVSVALLSLYVKAKRGNETARPKLGVLPEDVERVLEGYRYMETNDNVRIAISGKRIIRRGRKVLGLRSNLVKTNFFESVSGTLRTDKKTVVFSAADAEWDADPSHPFILKRSVSLAVNERLFSHVKNAKIYFKQGVLEIDADRNEIIQFKQ